MNCKICELMSKPEAISDMKIYEDEKCMALLSRKPASICHVMIIPKEHHTIIEQVPDDIISHIFSVSSKISRAMFESLGIQGTNIYVENGTAAGQEIPHFIVHVIARYEKDELSLSWEPQKFSDEEISTVELMYKQQTEGVVFNKETETVKPEPVPEKGETKEKDAETTDDDNEEDYRIRYYDRIP